MDNSLKDKAALVFENLGIDISTAVRMFLKRAVMENSIPFRMTLPKQLYELYSFLEICNLPALFKKGDVIRRSNEFYYVDFLPVLIVRHCDFS